MVILSCSFLAKPYINTALSDALNTNETAILAELAEAQGSAVNIGGYYEPNEALTTNAMRASATLNAIIDAI